MKKAQLMDQPFVYIFTLIVIVVIVVIGFNLLNNIISVGEKVDYEAFIVSFKGELEDLDNLDKGSSVLLDRLIIPKDVKEICVIGEGSFIISNVINDNELFIKAMKLQENNIFFYFGDEERVYEAITIEDVKGSYNPVCDDLSDGKMDLKAVNYGGYVLVEDL